jgi:hypothetical protein
MFGPGILGTLGDASRRITRTTRLISFSDEQHRKQRKMLNPVFSIVHMREMSKLWTFLWSSKFERAVVLTFYRISYKVTLHLNLSN